LDVTTRAYAKERGLIYYYTGKPCRHGHYSKRFVYNGSCYECNCNGAKEWQKRNPTAVKEAHERYKNNRPEASRDRYRRYAKRYPHKITAKVMRRYASKTRATPRWLTPQDHSRIEGTYLYSRVRSQITGVSHHVDHIVPLRGRGVCGLHVPWNLQVIPASDNIRKSNKLPN
jgi:hypothetical protein